MTVLGRKRYTEIFSSRYLNLLISKLSSLIRRQRLLCSTTPHPLRIMCYTDNSAVHANIFLNAQLSSLWENAAACAKKLDLGQQTTANRTSYSSILITRIHCTQATPPLWPSIRPAGLAPAHLCRKSSAQRSINRPCDSYATMMRYYTCVLRKASTLSPPCKMGGPRRSPVDRKL